MFGWVKSIGSLVSGAVGRMLRGIMPVGMSDPPSMGSTELLEAYETMPWLQMAARKASDGVADALCFQVLALKRGRKALYTRHIQGRNLEQREKAARQARLAGELVEISDHVFLEALDQPNPFMDRRGLLHVTNSYLDIVGDAYWFIQRNGLGKPAGYWPIPATWVLQEPTPERPEWRVGFQGWQAWLKEPDLLRFRDPSLSNPYGRGVGLGWAIADDLEVDEYLAKMAKSVFFNQARPDFVVYGFEGTAEKQTAERNWLRTHQGFWRSMRPHFMTGKPEFKEFQRPTMEQIMYPQLREKQRDIVLQVYGHPPEIFGILDSSNRATIDAATFLFQKYVVRPRAERIRGRLQLHVAEEFDDRAILHYPDPVPEDLEFALKVAQAVPQSRQMDEWRMLQNLAPWGDERGQAYPVSIQHHMARDLFDPPPPKAPANPAPQQPQKMEFHAHVPERSVHVTAPVTVDSPITVQPAAVTLAAAEPPIVNVQVAPAEVRAGDVHAHFSSPPVDVEFVRDSSGRLAGTKSRKV